MGADALGLQAGITLMDNNILRALARAPSSDDASEHDSEPAAIYLQFL
jgi:hypothetical protein